MKTILAAAMCLCLVGCVYSTQTQTFEGATVNVNTPAGERGTVADSLVGIGTQVSIPRRENLMDMLKGSAAASVALPTGQAGDVSQATDLSGVRAAPPEPNQPDTPDAEGDGDGPGQPAESASQQGTPAADASGGD